MAVCLSPSCGSRRARVLHSRSAVVVEVNGNCNVVERICRRITLCPDCGDRRAQVIHDEGVTRRGRIVDEREELPKR